MHRIVLFVVQVGHLHEAGSSRRMGISSACARSLDSYMRQDTQLTM